MNLKILILTMLCSCLVSCNEKLTYCQFEDTVISSKATKDYTIALGTKGIYVLSGKYQIYGKVGKPGQLLGYSGICEFSLKDFLASNPALASAEITKLAEKQGKRLKNVSGLPNLIGPRVVDQGARNKDESPSGAREQHPVQLNQ